MVIRGAGGLTTRIHGARPRRRRPAWDNTIHDLKSLRLTPAELDARAKAFKSRDWTTGTRSSVRSSTKTSTWSSSRISVLIRSNSSGLVTRNSSEREFCSVRCLPGESEFHTAEETAMDAFGRVRVRRAGTAVTLKEKRGASPRKPTPVITSSDDDFDEDIRRLESLQRQKSHYPSLQEPPEYASLNTGCPDPHGTLLQYIETEMQKAWSEMCSQKMQAHRRAPRRREVRRRVKLQATVRPNACTGVRSLNKLLERQSSMVLKANQFFIQELQTHVQYQAEVIRELNEFRISAGRDLTSLVGLVQKLLATQERKDLVPFTDRTDEAKDALLELESKENLRTVDISPPKPREVPLYLKRRISPSLHVSEEQKSAEAETSLEVHKLPAKVEVEQLAKAVKGLPVKIMDAKTVDRVPAESVERLEAPEPVSVEPEESVPAASPKKVAENKRRLPSADMSNSAAVTGQADEFDKRENPLFETEKNKCIALPRGPYKKSRLQDHHFSVAAAKPTSRPASAEATKARDKADEGETRGVRRPTAPASVLCSPKKKPDLEQERQAKSRGMEDKSRRRLEVQPQKPATSAPASKRPVPAGPRLTLQGWSSAFLQPGFQAKRTLLRGC